MSSEMRECPFCGNSAWVVRVPDTRRFRPQCKKCGADLGEFDREADAVAAWNRRALLARTEAGADGAIDSRAAFERWAKPQGYRMHIRDTPGSARLGQYGDDSTQAAWEAWTASRTTRPQDARGDAELIEAVGTYEEAVRLFGRTSPSASRAYCRMTDVLAAMQAKEAK